MSFLKYLALGLCFTTILSCTKNESPQLDTKIKQEEEHRTEGNTQDSNKEKEKTQPSPDPQQDGDKGEKDIETPSTSNNPLPKEDKFKLIFAKGVTREHGWYDVDKLKRPEDIMTCWLITASNMLQWWQDRYTESGAILPSGTPNGLGDGPYKLAIFDKAIQSFTSLNFGGDISNGLSWYIRGTYPHIRGHARPKRHAQGGYLRSIPETTINYPERSFLDFDAWTNLPKASEVLALFSDNVIQKLNQGAVLGMDIKTHVGLGGGLHAISVWGVEVNTSEQVQAIYITDSDDFEKRLVRCPIEVVKNPSFPGWVLAMSVPISDAYTTGAKWEVLRLTYLAFYAS